MENLTYAELVAILGQEAADAIMAQRETVSGTKVPFPMIKKVAEALGNELGQFGDFVLGAEKKTEENGDVVYTSVGVNLGKSMEFVICGYAYYYKNYMEGAGKNGSARTVMSNLFRNLSEAQSATYKGNKLPADKDAKKAQGWKLVRVNVGLVRKDAKSEWLPAIFEVDSSMLFGFNNLLDKATGNGVLSNVFKIVSTHKKKGTTVFVVIDENASSVEPLDVTFLKENSDTVKDILNKFKEYVDSSASTEVQTSAGNQTPRTDDTTESGW